MGTSVCKLYKPVEMTVHYRKGFGLGSRVAAEQAGILS